MTNGSSSTEVQRFVRTYTTGDVRSSEREQSDQNGTRTWRGEGAEAGREAQEWLRRELDALLSAEGWNVSETAIRDVEEKETDILLTHPQKGEFHIEAKHTTSNVVVWPELEVKKAHEYKPNYFMAIMTPHTVPSQKYQIRWLWDPLVELLQCRRSGLWSWKTDSSEVEGNSWEHPITPEPKQPKFSFQAEVRNNFLDGKPSGLEAIKERLAVI